MQKKYEEEPMQDQFNRQVEKNIKKLGEDRDFIGLSNVWNREAIRYGYASNFSWLGRPIIQVPQDIYAIQELIWKIKPDLIIETGIAHGGSLIMSASILLMLDYAEAVITGAEMKPGVSDRKVIGIDIDIRGHNRSAIEKHPLHGYINMIQGSSIDQNVIDEVNKIALNHKTIMVFLDSNHTHKHVLAELESYAPLVTLGSYCVVWDTGVEDLPEGFVTNRPWGKGDNPKTAVWEFLRNNSNKFKVDKELEHKLAITASPDGFLQRI